MKGILWILIATVALAFAGQAVASVLMQEDFSYSPGVLLTSTGNWLAHSGSGTNPIAVTSSGLSYPGYPAVAGNAVSMTTSGEDDHSLAAWSATSGVVYYACLANVSAATATGDYFIHFYRDSSSFYGRVYCKLVAGALNFGITHSSGSGGTVNYSSTPFSPGTTHLFVVKYTFNSGSTTDDTADLWVDPPISGTEPSPLVSSIDVTSTDATTIIAMSLRQGTATSASTQWVDGIRVATSWVDVLGWAPPVGACCNPNGACTITAQSDCPYTWHSEFTSCLPNPCPQPTGSCCLHDGSCTVTSQTECSGTWTLGGTCNPNPCTQPTGSCCNTAGCCTVTLQSACSGTWTMDGTCDPNPCAQPYNEYFFTYDETPHHASWAYQGETVEFEVSGTTNPEIKGYAIAFQWDPSVFEWVSGPTILGTRGDGAIYFNQSHDASSIKAGVTYSTACPPSIPPGTGYLLKFTLMVKPTAPFGTTPLDITDLPPSLNRITPCSACRTITPIMTDGAFEIRPEPTGACCVHNGSCTVTTQRACAGIYIGDGTGCSPNPCAQPTGSCCLPDGSCTVTVHSQCAGRWTMDGSCDPNPCAQPTGSCCLHDGSCTVTLQSRCTGRWTLGGVCDPNPCELPTGSCCAVDGTCTVTIESRCTGRWTLDGVCDPNPCPQPTGACCAVDGSCTVTTQARCEGRWMGMGTICDPNPCPQPTGACCHPDGSCTVSTEVDCQGRWQGAGTVCDPNPCPQPTGACCFASGECRVLTRAACASQEGLYQGDGTGCSPNPCPSPVPTRHTTWGQIKNTYR